MTLEDKLLLVQQAVNDALTASDDDPVAVIQAGDVIARQARFLSAADIQRSFDLELTRRLEQKRTKSLPPAIPTPSRPLSAEALRAEGPFLNICACEGVIS